MLKNSLHIAPFLTLLLVGCSESSDRLLDKRTTERRSEYHRAMKSVSKTRMLAVTLPTTLEPEDLLLEVNGVYQQPFTYGNKHIPTSRMKSDGLYGFQLILQNIPMKAKLVIVKTGESTPFEIGISDGYWWSVHFAYKGGQLKVISQEHPILGYM